MCFVQTISHGKITHDYLVPFAVESSVASLGWSAIPHNLGGIDRPLRWFIAAFKLESRDNGTLSNCSDVALSRNDVVRFSR